MIIDRVRLAGDKAYFTNDNGNTNLAPSSITSTQRPGAGRQLEVRGINFYIEGSDLWQLFQRRSKPFLRISLLKEVFPGLFADPYRHRVHTIAGYNDFSAGKFDNCRVLEVDGEQTLVALAPGKCRWTSAMYTLPQPADFVLAAWSLATARPPTASNFNYTLRVTALDENDAAIDVGPLSRDSTELRSAPLVAQGVQKFKVEFAADIKDNGYFHEHHGSTGPQSVGRPLLRGFSWLEAVDCPHDFFSLAEFLALTSGYELFGPSDAPLPRLAATLQLPANLVTGPNENPAADLFEAVTLEVDPEATLEEGILSYLSAHLDAHVVLRPPLEAQA